MTVLVRAVLGAAALGALACGPAAPMMAGHLTSSGGELGSFVFAPDTCVLHADVDAIDLRDSHDPGLAVRVIHPETEGFVVVVANARAPSGSREVPLVAGPSCTLHKGYHSLLYGDAGIGIRVECTTPGGAHVSGAIGAGVCE